MKPVDGLVAKIEKLVDEKIAKALRGTTKTVPAEVTGTDDEGTTWVSLPGAESPTPVRRSSVEVSQGDIVSVTVGDGMAVIDSNISNPSAGLERVIVTQETANKAASRAISAKRKAEMANKSAAIATGIAKGAQYEAAMSLKAESAVIVDLQADTAKIHSLTADQLTAATGYIGELKSNSVTTDDLVAAKAKIGSLDANYARIDTANIDTATIRNAWVDALMVQTGLIAHEGTVYELDAIQVNASKIKAGTLDVERLVVTQGGQKYLVHVNAQGTPTYEKLDGNIIQDLTITADKIVAGAITAQKITTENIAGSGGWINLRNGTFEYVNASTGEGISWDGSHLTLNGTATFKGSIGGRNLVLGTGVPYYRAASSVTAGSYIAFDLYDMVGAYNTLNLVTGQYLTVSCDVTITGAVANTTLRIGTNAEPWEYFGNVATFAAGTSTKHIEARFAVTDALRTCTGTKFRFRIDCPTAASALAVTAKNVKLERGNTPTDWTPAPEDLPNDLASPTGTTVIDGGHIMANSLAIGNFNSYSQSLLSENLLRDTDVNTLNPVSAAHGRYWANASHATYVATSFVALSDPPAPGIKYAAQFVGNGTNTSSTASRALAFYADDGNHIPLVSGQVYTATWWGRKTAGNVNTRLNFSSGGETSNTGGTSYALTTSWQQFTQTFTPTVSTTYTRVWFFAQFEASKSGTAQLCGFKLVLGDSAEAAHTTANAAATTATNASKQANLYNIASQSTIVDNAGGWLRLGTLVSAGDSSNFTIHLFSGDGYNANATQNSTMDIVIKDGWQSSASATNAFGVSVTRENRRRNASADMAVKVIATAHNTCTVWVYFPWSYIAGHYSVSGRYTSWTDSQTAQASEPSGTAQNVKYYDPSETATNYIYADSSGIRIASANPSTQNQRLHMTSSAATFYDANNKARAQVDANGLRVYSTDGSTQVGKFADAVELGKSASATGTASVAIGQGTKAASSNQMALGRFNVVDSASKYVFIVGDGTSDSARSNIMAVQANGYMELWHPNLTVGSTPSANMYTPIISWNDKNGTVMGQIQETFYTDGRMASEFKAQRAVNGSNIAHGFDLIIAEDGTRSVYLSEAAPWLAALGLKNSSTTSVASNIVSAASGVTIVSAAYGYFGKVATVNIAMKRTSAIGSGNIENITLGTIASGKRPAIVSPFTTTGSGPVFTGYINQSGSIVMTATSGTIAANAEFSFSATYILA